MIAITTLNKIRAYTPCAEGWAKLLKHLGKTAADDEPLPLAVILESNGWRDAVWALRTIDAPREVRLFACDCAQAVAHLNSDPRVQHAIDVSRRFAYGEVSGEELEKAGIGAYAAAHAVHAAAIYVAHAAADAADALPSLDIRAIFTSHFCTP